MTVDWLETMQRFFERGGPVLWSILAVSSWLWVQIGESYVLLARGGSRRAGEFGPEAARSEATRALRLSSRVRWIQSLIAVLPLLGLLGTVGGMIAAFDALTFYGSTNPRALSLGISQALLTTIAGLVTSLAGLFAATPLVRRVRAALREASGGATSRDGLAVTPLLVLRARLLGRPARGEETL